MTGVQRLVLSTFEDIDPATTARAERLTTLIEKGPWVKVCHPTRRGLLGFIIRRLERRYGGTLVTLDDLQTGDEVFLANAKATFATTPSLRVEHRPRASIEETSKLHRNHDT